MKYINNMRYIKNDSGSFIVTDEGKIVAKILHGDPDRYGKLLSCANEAISVLKDMVERYPRSPWIYKYCNDVLSKLEEK